MATYVNNLRLKEITTGDEDGTWGTSTNTNLELIGEALGYNTQDGFATDADATTTVADGATDPARALYLKVTSSATLTATRTLTIAPNTVSRVMYIENATTGSQSINISQGSGANVTIGSGVTKVVYLDGAGAGAAVVDANANVPFNTTGTVTSVSGTGTVNGISLSGTVTSSGNITLGGALTGVDPTSSGTTAFTDFADLTFSTATITARGALIFNDSASGDPSVVVLDFGADKTSTAGDFTIVFPTADASNAIIRIA